MTDTTPPAPPDRAAGDVVAVGHEIGRFGSDGTIIGRAEPYAKVFASSRQVKRTVGVMAWAILEDIALDANIDDHGRLVATTNVRRIADNIGVSKNTVADHLSRLRDAGFVLHEEGEHDDAGRYTVSRYVLDPSACVERFTHTPSRHERTDTPDRDTTYTDTDVAEPRDGATVEDDSGTDPVRQAGKHASGQPGAVVHSPVENASSGDRAESATEAGSGPCTRSWDTEAATVSQSLGHRELGHKNKQEVVVLEEQHRARETPAPGREVAVVARLVDAGIAPATAGDLAGRHPPGRIVDAIDAVGTQTVDNPAGWIITALEDSWNVTDLATRARDTRRQRQRAGRRRTARRQAADSAARHARTQRRHNKGWADVAASVLDDGQLTRVMERLRDPRFPASSRSVRLTVAQVTGWVAAVCDHRPDLEPTQAVSEALTDPTELDPPDPLPPPPPMPPPSIALDQRVAATLEPAGGQPAPSRTIPHPSAAPSHDSHAA